MKSKTPKTTKRVSPKKPTIKIKKSKVGSLKAALNVPKNEKIPAEKLAAAKKKAKKTGDTALMKKVTFAQNAKKWKKK